MAPRIIPDAVRRQQTAATDPAASVFVSANAGAGKTHVLAQRVIRLMLDGGPHGVEPGRILCITFTKAAAANMASRVYDRLKSWIALDDDALDAAIRDIGVTAIDAAKRQRARRLFASALDTPGGLKVQTIHAFCTRVLQQFPFEAGVAAHFSVLEDRTRAEMLARARMAVLLEAAAAPARPLGRALATAAAAAPDATLVKVIDEAIAARNQFAAFVEDGPERAVAQLAAALGVSADDSVARVDDDIVEGPHLPLSRWADAAAVLDTGSSQDRGQAQRFMAARAACGDERIARYLEVFLTDGGEPRKSLITRRLAATHTALNDALVAEQLRITGLRERRGGVLCRDRTAALATLAVAVIARYTEEKQRRGVLDYDDLIAATHRLLCDCDPGWVHHKLDLGLDHVLIDEAQDTSEKQWDIVKRLVSEFGAGVGAGTPRLRTVFAVGDEKQSIFSFQGAAPREYDAARRYFQGRFTGADVAWRAVRFDHSFRSGDNVLGAVDAVFADAGVYRSITAGGAGRPVHVALPGAVPGTVDIWPLTEPDPAPEITAWQAPFDAVAETSPQVKLAARIAGAVRGLVAAATPVGGDRRPMRYGDVLILVRQRGPLFGAVIRALKNAGVAVAGADRLVLTEHVAVTDLMALADALLLPDDDLALAVALKSPLFGLSEEQLFDLAHGRPGSLRQALVTRAAAHEAFARADALLSASAGRARGDSPFAFFAWLLGPAGGRRRMFARLGLEAADALDEFLELALSYESFEAPSLQGFLAWLRSAATEVKRDMETSRDEVRVMTVHGAKGLEAPVVILADTTTPPRGAHPPTLVTLPQPAPAPERTGCARPAPLVWAPRRDDDIAAVAQAREAMLDEHEHEHRRLLYVAMTRAAERLIVCGCQGRNKVSDRCWYRLIETALANQPGFAEVADGDARLWRYRRTAAADGEPLPAAPGPSRGGNLDEPALPSWLTTPVTAAGAPVSLSPSAAIPEATAASRVAARRSAATLPAQAQARARGTLIHRLLQSLPDIAPDRRPAAAKGFLERAGAQFSATLRELFAANVLAIIDDPQFAALFRPGSRAEVSIVGRLEGVSGATIAVAGQIDRLAVTPDAVLIADYKTNRDAPGTVAEALSQHWNYVGQLALYRAVLGKIHPDRPVRAALVWTEIPALMEIPAAKLDEALHDVTRSRRECGVES